MRAIDRFAEEHNIPRLKFERGQDKEKTAAPYLNVRRSKVKIGLSSLDRHKRRPPSGNPGPHKGQEKVAHPHMDWGRQMAYIDHFYFYLGDQQWGGTFCKTNAYAPFPIWLWLNGQEWAKRQLEKAGIGYEALDNGFRSCANPIALQEICDRLGAAEVESFLARWLHRLPSPFTAADQKAGYSYELTFR